MVSFCLYPKHSLFFSKMLLFLFCVLVIGAESFMVKGPERSLVAIRGHPAVLGCTFTPDLDLSNLEVTWLRQEDSRVVHSFYFKQDQLDRQSPEYHSRTSLFISELAEGNASLRISAVRPKDAGRYLCLVSNAKGTGKTMIEVNYGALYSEPRLSIHVNFTRVTVKFETEGFPKPEVNWVGDQGQNLSHYLELQNQTEDGFYFIMSSYEAQKPALNVTFTLKNHLLNQKLQRPVVLIYVSDEDKDSYAVAVIVLSIASIILFAVLMFLLYKRRRKPLHHNEKPLNVI